MYIAIPKSAKGGVGNKSSYIVWHPRIREKNDTKSYFLSLGTPFKLEA